MLKILNRPTALTLVFLFIFSLVSHFTNTTVFAETNNQDTEPPVVNISNPTSGQQITKGTSVNILATISDTASIEYASLYIDTDLLETYNYFNPFDQTTRTITYTLDTSNLTIGQHTISISAQDAIYSTYSATGTYTGTTGGNIGKGQVTINIISQNQVATPTFSPIGGTYTSTQNVTISCETSGSIIRYTTDGSEPISTSTQYSSPISISASTTLKAKAFNTGMTDSETATASYTISTNNVDNDAEARKLLVDQANSTLRLINSLDPTFKNDLQRTIDEINKAINNSTNMTKEEAYFYYIGIKKVNSSVALVKTMTGEDKIATTMTSSFDKTIESIISVSLNVNKTILYLKKISPSKSITKAILNESIKALTDCQNLLISLNTKLFDWLQSKTTEQTLINIISNTNKNINKEISKYSIDITPISTKEIFNYINKVDASKIYQSLDNNFMNYCWYKQHTMTYSQMNTSETNVQQAFFNASGTAAQVVEAFDYNVFATQQFVDGFKEAADILDIADDGVKVVKLITICKTIYSTISNALDVGKIVYTLNDSTKIYNSLNEGVNQIWNAF